MNTSITQEQRTEAIDWTSDCLGMSRGVKVSAERAIAYVGANYPGGWGAFVAECCTPVQLDGYGSRYRPFAGRPMVSVTLDKI